jgi:lipopolysaccharide export system permease protein
VLEAAAPVSTLDRYVARIVVGAFAGAMVFFVFLTVVVDLLNNVGKYADLARERGMGSLGLAYYLASYYVKMVPVTVTTAAPFASAIAGMFAVARLQHANEIVPMLFVGRSIHRILRPMVGLGVVAGLAMAACWQWVIPHVGADLATHRAFLDEGTAEYKFLVDERRGEPSQRFYVQQFRPSAPTRQMVGVCMLVQGTLAADAWLVMATAATWDAARGDWRLEGGERCRQHESEAQEWLERPDLTPAVLVQRARDTVEPDTMSYTELVDLAVARPHQVSVRLALHRHLTWPLANVLLLLLVLPMAVHYERGGRITRVLAAIGFCGGYLLLDLICQRLGARNLLHPIVAAWTPPIFFGALGTVLYGSART